MSFDLKQVFEVTGEVLEFDLSMDLSDYDFSGQKPFRLPVRVFGRFENKAGVVFLSYEVGLKWEAPCDRCLEVFDRSFTDSFEHVLVTKLHTDNDEYLIAENFRFDLEETVISDVLLYLPSKLLCGEDCKGLCSKCGQNLNVKECRCAHETEKKVDPRLAALGELLK